MLPKFHLLNSGKNN